MADHKVQVLQPTNQAVKSADMVCRPTVGVVTVTYNSDRFFDPYLQSLANQTWQPDIVVLVDSGSSDSSFLTRAHTHPLRTKIIHETNVGVCVGNNIGWRVVRDLDYVLFLNPDAFLAPDFFERALAYMEAEPSVGMVTPSLLRFDIENQKTLDEIDTTGVVRNRFGFIVERDQGEPISELSKYSEPNSIPWLCTAVALGRQAALETVIESRNELFDESFFMYKDDTDLSWRVRRAGWKIVHHPGLLGSHCRGWQDRKRMSKKGRLLTARNEIRMCIKNRSPFFVVGLLKYWLVNLFNI